MNKLVYDKLRSQYPWPQKRPLLASDAFDLSLDGGGRELMKAVLTPGQSMTMVEIGAFLGGSALRWLRENPSLTLVCVDPWPDSLDKYVAGLVDVSWAAEYGRENLKNYAKLISRHGTLKVVQNNLWEYRDRVILIQRRLQDAVGDLTGLDPDVIYLDAQKERAEFQTLDHLFPDAVFTGDDWSWKDKDGDRPVPRYAHEVAIRRKGHVYGHLATFVISEPRFGFKLPSQMLYAP